jgi:hypothetical protein
MKDNYEIGDKVEVRIFMEYSRKQKYLYGTGRIKEISGGKKQKTYKVKLHGVRPEVFVRSESLKRV